MKEGWLGLTMVRRPSEASPQSSWFKNPWARFHSSVTVVFWCIYVACLNRIDHKHDALLPVWWNVIK